MSTLSVKDDHKDQLLTIQQKRYELISLLSEDPQTLKEDKELRRDVTKILKDCDSQILTLKRIDTEDENAKNDQNIKAAFAAVMLRNGGNLPPAEIGVLDSKPDVPDIESFNFDIPESELIIGNDIDVE